MTATTFSSTNLTCSNTYCHNPAASGILKNAVNTGSNIFPSWTGAKYLGDTRKTQANCGVCHKVPGDTGFEPATTHPGMTIAATACTPCHGHEGDNTGTKAGQRHMDGVLYGAGDCDSCHGYQAASWGVSPALTTEGTGAHAKHVAYLVARYSVTLAKSSDVFGTDTALSNGSWSNVCGVCHDTATAVHKDSARTIKVATTYSFGGTPTYLGVSGGSSATNPKTCSNVSCHYMTTPLWSTY
jgi:predicted CxxxxCH...CXXCH cytochrome family protein